MKVVRSILFFTTVISLLMISSFYLLKSFSTEASTDEVISLLTLEATPEEEKVLSFFSSGLEDAVNDALEGSKATYSVIVKNLETGETYSRNPDKVYQTASLYKLWIMAVTYQQLEDGTLKKDQTLSNSVESLNKIFNIASESAELTEGTISYSVEEAIEKSITISDNYAALLLSSKIRLKNVTTFLKENNLTHSKIGNPPQTTPADISLFYEKLYKGEMVSQEASLEMIEILKKQRLNDRIPKYLPDDVEVAHKTGELEEAKHDAGIVYTDKGDYLLIMLSESNNPSAAAERMAKISQNIYDYFMK